MFGFIMWIVTGILAGYVAGQLFGGKKNNMLVNFVLGILGGVIGGWVCGILGINILADHPMIGSFITSVLGALLFLFVWNKVVK